MFFTSLAYAQSENEPKAVEFEFRSLPAAGFFPMGGRLTGGKSYQVSGSATGLGIDIANLKVGDRSTVSLVNLSPYLLGVSWSDLVSTSNTATTWVQWAYIRGGPAYRQSHILGQFTLGMEAGYAALVKPGDNWTTEAVHGFDISLFISWTGTYGFSGCSPFIGDDQC